jgi:hypothetical protein
MYHEKAIQIHKAQPGHYWLFILTAGAFAEMRPITGKPIIDSLQLLEWPYDGRIVIPNLNDPTSNVLNDFHAGISSCELVLSSQGNLEIHMRQPLGWQTHHAPP